MTENTVTHTGEPPRNEVQNLQRYLRTLSYRYPEIPAPPVDGIFDSATRASLEAFQAIVGLPVTGEADRTTWEALYAAYLDALFNASLPTPLPVFPHNSEDYTAKEGDSGFLVVSIQHLLNELTTLYSFPSPVTESGVYDRDTADAVAYFQRLCLLRESGEVDKRTWNYLVGAYIAEDASREQA